MMSDLVEFLRARLAEDEAAIDREREQFMGDYLGASYALPWFHFERLRWDVQAKRRIVDHFTSCAPWSNGGTEAVAHFDGFREAMDFTVRRLAAVYADHPDYRDEWKP